MEALLVKYGYLLLFGGIMLEGEAFLLAAAFLAQRGYFDLPSVIVVAVSATMLGDQIYFRAARARGRSWVERRRGTRARYAKIIAMTEKRGFLLILASRWAFGLRMVIPAACGATGMSPRAFTLMDFVAVTIWAVALGLAGYKGGAAIAGNMREIRNVGVWVGLAVVLVVSSLMATRRLRRQGRVRELGWSDLHAVVPFVMGLIGVFNVATALWPHGNAPFSALGRWLPLDVPGNRLMTLFAGLALLQVTRNLSRRKELAWWVATAAVALSLFGSVQPAFDLQRSLVPALLLAYLLVFRRHFTALSDPATLRRALAMAPVIALAIVAYAYVGLRAFEDHFAWPPNPSTLGEAVRTGIVMAEPQVTPLDIQARRFLESIVVAGWLARLYLLVLILRPVILRVRQEAPSADVDRIRQAHADHAMAAFALQPDKHHVAIAGGSGLAAFVVRNAVAVACGDPLCPDDAAAQGAREFVDHCRRHGWTPCLMGASPARREAYAAAGLRSARVAAEAVVDLRDDSVPRPVAHQPVRRYVRSGGPDGVPDEQMVTVSDAWLDSYGLKEVHFTFGGLDLDALGRLPVFVAEGEGGVLAFCSWLPYRDGRAMALDLLRHRPEAPPGTCESLVAASLEVFRIAGVEEASLGFGPLAEAVNGAGDGEDPAPSSAAEREASLVADRLVGMYHRGDRLSVVRAFRPRWDPLYLVYPADMDLPRIAVAVMEAHTSLHDRHAVARVIAVARSLLGRVTRRRRWPTPRARP